MKLHEKGSWFFWIIVIGMVSGWFGTDDDTKQVVVETANTVVESIEKEWTESNSNAKAGETAVSEIPHADVARLKDIITSAIYESAVAEITAGNEVTLHSIWAKVNLKVIDAHGEETAIKFIADSWPDDNTAIVWIGGEKSVINFDADVGMVRNIEPFEETPQT